MFMFRYLLGQPRLEPTDSFLHWGGDSLGAAVAAGQLGCEPYMVLAFPSARQLARHLQGGEAVPGV